MKQITAALIVWNICATPLAAQDGAPPSLMERGAQQFFEGLLLEMEPALEGMRGFVAEMGPALTELMGKIDDWSVYEVPEILPNGDIIIRRKPRIQPQIDL